MAGRDLPRHSRDRSAGNRLPFDRSQIRPQPLTTEDTEATEETTARCCYVATRNQPLALGSWPLAETNPKANLATCCYPATTRINSEFQRHAHRPTRRDAARVDTGQALAPQAQPQSRSFDSAQDFACGLPLSRGAGSLTPAKRAQVVKERITSRLPYSPATAGSRLPKGPRLAKRVARR